MTISLLCLVGLPGSGKTTLTSDILSYIGRVRSRTLEYDSVLSVNDFLQGAWKISRQTVLKRIPDIVGEMCETTSEQNGVIILDDNFFYRSMRYEVYKTAKSLQLGFGQIFLDVPLNTCLSRNAARENPLPSDVILKMSSIIEPPDPQKHSWEEYSMVWNWADRNLDPIYQLVANTWEQPCCPKPEIQSLSQPNSVVHLADLALRSIIATTLSSTTKERRGKLAKQLAETKKNILENIRVNNIQLPVGSPDEKSILNYINFLKPHITVTCSNE